MILTKGMTHIATLIFVEEDLMKYPARMLIDFQYLNANLK